MSEPIEFYFDFSSPYGYLASHRIDDLGAKHGREVIWRPFLLGAAFQVSGERPLVEQPLKGEYSLHDLERWSRLLDIPFKLPDPFPIPTMAAGRAFYWLDDDDPGLAKRFAAAAYRAYFADGTDIRATETVADIAAALGADRDACAAAIADPRFKDRLRAETDRAIERGAFGSPFFFVGEEPFWGNDRIEPLLDLWLGRGGW